MKLINIRLLTDNAAESIRFWRDVVQLPLKYSDESMGYAYFETDFAETGVPGAGVELVARTGYTPAPQGQGTILVFEVDNVEARYTELTGRGAQTVAGPQDRPAWGVRNASVADPDGNILEIYTKLA